MDNTTPPATNETRSSRLDAGMAVLFIAGFAFLLASFPVRNADVWGHLAAGRDLAGGHASAATATWAPGSKLSSGWLYNLTTYSLYSLVNEVGLVLVKCAIVVAMALLMLSTSRARSGWVIATFCTGLALLAMSNRLLLQPATVSLFFLALTVWFLWQRDPAESPVRSWPLWVVFLVWANVDRWFVVGLGVVALTWVGQILDTPAATRWRVGRQRAIALALLVAVCLLNPAHVRAFRLALTPGGRSATSPFQALDSIAANQSPAELAYFPLFALGLLSFVLALPRWHWGRFLPWAGLAVLSAVQLRFIPLFALVAGPVLAWNLQDFFSRRAEAGSAASAVPRWRMASRVLVGLVGLVFLACAWPGWLQAPPFEPRRWGFDLPPALQGGGETMGRWQAEERFGSDARGLHLSSPTAHAFAWFCPDHRGIQDDSLAAGILEDPDRWNAQLRAAGVNHLIVYDSDRERLAAMHAQLLADPDQWSLLFSEGDLAVFGWRDPSRRGTADPFEELRLNFDRLALQPGPGERAPAARPASDPQPRVWWEAFWKPAPPRPIERDAALFHLLHAQAARASAPYREVIGWESAQLAGLVGSAWSATGPAGLLDVETRLVFFRPPMLRPGVSSHPIGIIAVANRVETAKRRDDSPMAVLYLAIRAARRALAVNPLDAQAYAALGEAYLQLFDSTRERAWSRQLPELAQLRRVQAVAALTQAVTLDPNLSRAHRNLATLYYRLGYLDLALKHQRAFLQAARKAGPPPGMPAGQFHDTVTEAEQELGPLQDAVDERERVFKEEASGARVFDRAAVARDLGLVGKAVDILLNSDVSAFGVGGMALELELLVSTGRVKEVREWTAVEQLSAIGAMYHWLRALAFAGSGDYALAQEECVLLAMEGSRTQGGSRNVMAAIVAQAVLDEQPGVGGATWLFGRAITRADFRRQLVGLTYELQRAADAMVLRGMLALEMGDVDEAEVAFRLALDTWGSDAAAREGRGIDFNARVVAQECLKWLERREPGR